MSGVFHRSALTVGNVKDKLGISIENRAFEVNQITNNLQPWIRYGNDNQHPQFLIQLAHKSQLHNSILQTKANLILGEGITITGENEDLVKKANEFLEEVGADHNFMEGLCWDMALFGESDPQLIYGVDESVKRSLQKVYKTRFEELRLGKPEKLNSGINAVQHVYLHKDWKNPWQPDVEDPNNPRRAKRIRTWFKEGDKDYGNIEFEQQRNLIYRVKRYTPLLKYYPVPDYQTEGGINAILMDAELVSFDISELENGMTAQYLVTFVRKDWSKSDPDKETEIRKAEEDLVRDSMRGTENAARIIIARSEPPSPGQDVKKAIDITEIPSTNNEGRHKIMDERKNLAMLIAHGIPTPEIASIPNLNKTGFADQAEKMITATKLFYGFRILPLRVPIVNFFKKILKEKDENFAELKVEFRDRISLTEKITDIMWKHAFDENEYRTSRGYPEMTPEELDSLRENRDTGKDEEPKKEGGTNE